jgi:hypothetical protein
MTIVSKDGIKQALATVPFSAKAYWYLVDLGGPTLHFRGLNSLERLRGMLPEWCSLVKEARAQAPSGKNLMIFATFRYWIEHATLLGLTLATQGHGLTLAYLPYAKYKIPANRFDLERQDAYVSSVLQRVSPLVEILPLYKTQPSRDDLPAELKDVIEEISLRDAQYALRVENVDRDHEIYRLREERNTFAARLAITMLDERRPELLIVPNGSILEYGVIYHVARHMGVPVVTYEFDEPQHRIRLAQDAEVMREDTGEFWEARRTLEFSKDQQERVRDLLAARQKGSQWANFPIQFQGVPQQGAQRVRSELKLDQRPIALMAPNVFGDSATLGRQIFSHSMTEWLERTVNYFARRHDVQLVIRIHPSEARFPEGTSMEEAVYHTLPSLPEHIHLIPADAPINTYDLVEISDLGLVYTTTVGMEMAMSGVPVVVTGFTHYRGKGFTLDPASWSEYFEMLDKVMRTPGEHRLTQAQVTDVWHYAYRFFFEFTLPFPWHLLYFWDDVAEWPLERVLSPEGQSSFKKTFRYLVGEPLDWSLSS